MQVTHKDDKPTFSKFMHFYVNAIFYLFGFCALLSWNAFLNAIIFFMSKVRSGNNRLANVFTSSFSVASKTTLLLSVICNGFVILKYDRCMRVYLSTAVTFIGFLIVTCLVPVDTSNHGALFFGVIIGLTVILQVASNALQCAFFALLAYFPVQNLNSYINGQAVAGVFVSALAVVIKAANLGDIPAFLIYFTISLVLLALSFILYFFFRRSAFFNAHVDSDSDKVLEKIKGRNFLEAVAEYKRIYMRIIYPINTIFLNFMITLFIFPALPLRIGSTSGDSTWQGYFILVHVFLVFNCGDFIGRLLTYVYDFPKTKMWLMLLLTSGRVLFFLAYVFCNKVFRADIPVYMFNDAFPILFMSLFSITNGYFFCISCSDVRKLVGKEDSEIANTLVMFALSSGLAAGAYLALCFELAVS